MVQYDTRYIIVHILYYIVSQKEEVVELNEMLSEAGEVFKKNEQQMEDLQSTVESCNRKINDKVKGCFL